MRAPTGPKGEKRPANVNARAVFNQARFDKNIKGTYHGLIVIKEAMMQKVAVETLRDFAELVALGAFLTMIALAARAFGA